MNTAAPNPRFFALIPCAGTGSRAGTPVPKQYQPLAGRPLVVHTLAAFAAVPRIAQILVVVGAQDTFWEAQPEPIKVVACGGPTRAVSVFNGLKELSRLGADPSDWVLVHDAARCLITPEQIIGLIDACRDDPVGGLLAHKAADTIKSEVDGRVSATVPRQDKWLAQTPQMFRLQELVEALAYASQDVTDEASAIEATGAKPLLVPGSAQNFKVTYPDDFALAEAVLRSRQA